jgi:hypothetical protein
VVPERWDEPIVLELLGVELRHALEPAEMPPIRVPAVIASPLLTAVVWVRKSQFLWIV